jgi:polygalacturonase
LALLAQTQDASTDTAFTSFAFPATGAPTPRTMPNRLAEVVNVKDFGATGDARTDDTTAIQAALNAAYGSPSSPNGGFPGAIKNRAVFFPAGYYKMVRSSSRTDVSIADLSG